MEKNINYKIMKNCLKCKNNTSTEYIGNDAVSVFCGKHKETFTPMSKCDSFEIENSQN